MNKLLFAIDYDGTYSADPYLFNDIIDMIYNAGHEVICVTMRYSNIDIESKPILNSIGKRCEVIFTGRMAKLTYLESQGISPDIWVDDQPYFIFKDG